MGWSLGVSKLHFISAYVWQQRCVNKPREENALTIHVSLKRAAITHGSATPSASQFSCMCHKRTPRPQNSKDRDRETKLFVQNSTSKLMILDDTFTRKGRKIQRRKKHCNVLRGFPHIWLGDYDVHLCGTLPIRQGIVMPDVTTLSRTGSCWDAILVTRHKTERNGNIKALSYIKTASLSMPTTK